jgi:hypothetical protein
MRNWKHWVAVALLGLSCAATRAQAAPAFYEFALTPVAIGADAPFGIAGLPAGPFIGSFSFDDALLVSGSVFTDNRVGDMLSFELTIGDMTWALDDLLFFGLDISGGAVQRIAASVNDGEGHSIGFGFAANPLWAAFDEVSGCGLANLPFTSPGCIVGRDADTTFERQATVVAEPGALPLFAAAAAGLMLLPRRRDIGKL